MENTNNFPTAYEGKEPYIFVSYAHKDKETVRPIVEKLRAHGCRIWCDDKLIVGENYNAAIARHLRGCDAVLFCLSQNWMQSGYCRQEATVGIEQFQKKVALLYLEPCDMHDEVLMLLAGKHAVNTSDQWYLDKLLQSTALRDCIEREKGAVPAVAPAPKPKYKTSKGLVFDLIPNENAYFVKGIGSCKDAEIIIPHTYRGKSVTRIGEGAFYGCSSPTNITIPNSVTCIEDAAFRDCSALRNIMIPNSITSIGKWAFCGCSTLSNIIIPNSVTSIGYGVLSNCTGLTSITVENGNTTYHSAGNCLIETASETLVAGCKSSAIPTDSSVTSIEKCAFASCYSLTNITIPNSVKSIGESAFQGCYYLANILIPNSVTNIATQVFGDCSSLTNITIPNSVTSIDHGAFEGCSSLTNITIPNSVKSIGECAFGGCTSLTNITIPNGVTRIGFGTFQDCSSLTNITISNSVMSIGKWAFQGCSSLTNITIPNSVTSIGGWAFDGCSSLTNITIPNSVTSIGEEALTNCTRLTSITVENGNTTYHSVGNCLIEMASGTLVAGCKSSAIPIDGSVTSIGEKAFAGCSSLTNITIPNSVTNIGGWAFYGCSLLTNIRYNGTKECWARIEFGNGWKHNVPAKVVHCSDGDIAIEDFI